ncbi:hypothetical protein [Photobacterium sp. J15]|uniref:hypothetical protein n=1 Tax=Photobacterium sp. J15 TaxID=265901 RepID=UPI0012EEA692|nr:hypothetical protein [Photobacterium sp. J15]
MNKPMLTMTQQLFYPSWLGSGNANRETRQYLSRALPFSDPEQDSTAGDGRE